METTWWTQPDDLDDAQREVIALPLSGKYLIVGPPGSGKTNLLVLRAAHFHNAGLKNIVVMTYGRVLREFLASGAQNYVFPPDRIQTYVSWAANLIISSGGDFVSSKNFDQDMSIIRSKLKILAKQADVESQYDCILIDEVQDYQTEDIGIMFAFAKRIFAVGDNRQRIYQQNGAIDFLTANVDVMKKLPHHYRNGEKICRVADGIQNLVDDPDGMEATSNYDEEAYKSTVVSHPDFTVAEQVQKAIPDISLQLRAYPDGIIGVLCPRHAELDEVWGLLSTSSLAGSIQLQKYADGYSAFESDKRVIVTTIHGAKGLEFRALHLLGMDKIQRFANKQRRLSYTAVTRAKTSLSIYHKEPLPGYFENGLKAAEGTVVKAPDLSTLFKNGR